MDKIIVHDGKAHQDDFLASCVCAYKLNAPIFRTKATQEHLCDSSYWVLDQGKEFDPNLHNFDHHQIEKEICSFTMVLDFFYNNNYREHFPNFRFVEIFDSYGPKPAAEFAKANPDSLENITSPIHVCMVRFFSKIDGEVLDPLYSVMKQIGKEICDQIENIDFLYEIVNKKAEFITYKNYKILDITKCEVPENIRFDQLPTKIYCRQNNIHPDIILTVDSRLKDCFRMISTNIDVVKFEQNDISIFTHNSGFLTNFKNYEDYKKII